MEDLLQSQIQDSCRLALPEGLQDLMCDISREVLRYQPEDVHNFIADYLSVLLESREAMSIACDVYQEICQCHCQPHLEQELRDSGLNEDDVVTAKNVILKYFFNGKVKEDCLIMKLTKETGIKKDQLPSILNAIRKAFLLHQIETKHIFETNFVEGDDKPRTAAIQTIKLYESGKMDNLKETMATKIQALFRGYLVRRNMDCEKKSVEFGNEKKIKKKPKECTSNKLRASVATVSSTCLAGSYLRLPKYVPYSAININEFEEIETERGNIIYDDHRCSAERKKFQDNKKKLLFREVLPTIHHNVDEDEPISYVDEEIEETKEPSECSGETIEEEYLHKSYEQKMSDMDSECADNTEVVEEIDCKENDAEETVEETDLDGFGEEHDAANAVNGPDEDDSFVSS